MPEQITTYLLTQGVLGVVCVALIYVCIKLYNKTERQQARIEELHELRLQDSREIQKEITGVLEGNSQSNRILAEKIEVGKARGTPQ